MKLLKKTAIVLAGCYLFITAFMFLLQEKLIFLPTQLPQDYVYNFERPFEEFFIETTDGARLNALRFTIENPKGIVLYYHGNAGDLSRWGEITSFFLQFDYEVLVMDYRTYGKSTGTLNERELYKDASLFYDKAMEWFSEEKIVVYGRSLGSTFAAHVAAENEPKQLILEAPFLSLEAVAKKRYWFLPIKPMLKYTFPTSEIIKGIKSPITIFHGMDDTVVPYENGALLQKIPSETECKLVTITKGSHNDLINFSEYQEEIKRLLKD
jgi:alpha-beta hydrolase superfamily lysophospholipase